MDALTFGPVDQIDAGMLNVGYVDIGPADGQPVVLLHGWPYDIHCYAEVAPALGAAGYRVIVPHLRGYGTTRFLSDTATRNGQQSALAVDVIDLMDALGIESAIVAGFDWGARSANVVAALWPAPMHGLVSVSGYLIGNPVANAEPLPPSAELSWWYQFYFATERGRAGYDKYRDDFAKLIWHTASPQMELRRRDVRPQRGVLRQRRPRRHRDPQLPVATRAGARRTPVRRPGTATRRPVRPSRCRRSPSKVTPTARPTRTRAPTQRSSRGSTRTEPSPAASGTTCRKKRPKPSSRPSSKRTTSRSHDVRPVQGPSGPPDDVPGAPVPDHQNRWSCSSPRTSPPLSGTETSMPVVSPMAASSPGTRGTNPTLRRPSAQGRERSHGSRAGGCRNLPERLERSADAALAPAEVWTG